MRCDKKLLSGFIDGELCREEEEQLKGHLHECSACARELEELSSHQVLMEDLFVRMKIPSLPLGFETRFKARLDEEKSRPGILDRLFPLPPRLALAGAGVTVAIGLLLSLLLPSQELVKRREPSGLMFEVISKADRIQEEQLLEDQAKEVLKRLL